MPTKEELIEMGKKAYARIERDKLLTQARTQAIQKLVNAHSPEYEEYLDQAKRALGLL